MSTMVGYDLGSESCCITVCSVELNTSMIRNFEAMTPDLLIRYSTTDLKSHFSQIKRLLGMKFTDTDLQLELDFLPFRVIEGHDGCPLIHIKCMGDDRAFTPITILSMLISYLASEVHPPNPMDFRCCIGVPIYFTEQQRKDVLEAGKIAGLKSPDLLHETVAMALGYENTCYATDVFKNQSIVAFVDIGHASMQVCFAKFKSTYGPTTLHDTNMFTKIIYQGFVRSLGGRNFTKVLFSHFASMFRFRYSLDVYESATACICLFDACERLKKELSEKNEASLCIENFLGFTDIQESIKRKDFENMSSLLLKKVKDVLETALRNSGLTAEMIHSVEAVGNGCLMPAIINILRGVFGKKPRTMKCSDEYVARGCAIQSREKLWIARQRTDLIRGWPSTEIVPTEPLSDNRTDEYLQSLLWRRTMSKEGHLVTSLSVFLEKNIEYIKRCGTTKDESYWLRKALQSSKRNTASIDKAKKSTEKSNWFWKTRSQEKRDETKTFYALEDEKEKNEPDSESKEKHALQGDNSMNGFHWVTEQKASSSKFVFSEIQKHIEELSKDKEMQNEIVNENEQKPIPKFELLEFQKIIEQLKSERDNARKEVEELRQLSLENPRTQCVEFSYSDLQDATNNFHESMKLGEGGFGIVYKGTIHETTVAIKMLKDGSSQGAQEFNQEVAALSMVRHPNLVTLIGACSETRALIYEYLPQGSLEDHLRCKNNTSPLPWQARVRIAFEICTALSFLHHCKPHGIVHGDLKPDNILLDSNNISKISDFGLCRQLNWTDSASIAYHWTDCPKGTLAYMDPEYLSTGKITPQYDVYSFGIMLLRLVTCKEPRGLRHLVEEAKKKGTLKTLVDASAGPWPFKEANKMISLGLRCSDLVRKNRPDLSTKVLKEMKSMLDIASASGSS